MLYTKAIEQITFDDVVNFCGERHRESIHLDCKRNIENNSLARTMAAMANT
jgi:hypothetical protein